MSQYDPFVRKRIQRISRAMNVWVWILLMLITAVIFSMVCTITISKNLTAVKSLVVDGLIRMEEEIRILKETINKLEFLDDLQAQISSWQPHYSTRVTTAIASHVIRTAVKYNVDPSLIVAVGALESRWNLHALGGSGERGPLQVLPSTFRWLGGKNLRDWRETMEMGVKYLSMALKKAGGDARLAVAFYNCGINKTPGRARQLTSRHVQRFDEIQLRT